MSLGVLRNTWRLLYGWERMLVLLCLATVMAALSLLRWVDADGGRFHGGHNSVPVAKVMEIIDQGLQRESQLGIWQEAMQGQVLFDGDEVFTPQAAELTLQLFDGTRITLEEQTLVVLRALDDKDVELGLAKGGLTVHKVQSSDKGAQPRGLVIVSGQSRATITKPGTQVRLAKPAGRELQLAVNAGAVRFSKANQSAQIGKGEEIFVGTQEGFHWQKPIKLITPIHLDTHLIKPGEALPVTFQTAAKGPYTVRITRSKGGQEVFYEQTHDKKIDWVPDLEGNYKLQVKAGATQSLPLVFRLAWAKVPKLLYPEQDRAFIEPKNGEGKAVSFEWLGPAAARYQWVLKPDTQSQQSKLLRGTGPFSLRLPADKYRWQVFLLKDGQRLTHSKIRQFKILEGPKTADPVTPVTITEVYPKNLRGADPLLLAAKNNATADQGAGLTAHDPMLDLPALDAGLVEDLGDGAQPAFDPQLDQPVVDTGLESLPPKTSPKVSGKAKTPPPLLAQNSIAPATMTKKAPQPSSPETDEEPEGPLHPSLYPESLLQLHYNPVVLSYNTAAVNGVGTVNYDILFLKSFAADYFRLWDNGLQVLGGLLYRETNREFITQDLVKTLQLNYHDINLGLGYRVPLLSTSYFDIQGYYSYQKYSVITDINLDVEEVQSGHARLQGVLGHKGATGNRYFLGLFKDSALASGGTVEGTAGDIFGLFMGTRQLSALLGWFSPWGVEYAYFSRKYTFNISSLDHIATLSGHSLGVTLGF